MIIDLTVTDKKGQTVESFADPVSFEYDAESLILLGTGNGDPIDHDPVVLSEKHAFAGQLQAIFSQITKKTGITVITKNLPAVMIPLP